MRRLEWFIDGLKEYFFTVIFIVLLPLFIFSKKSEYFEDEYDFGDRYDF